MPENSQEELSPFQRAVKAIDPKVLATAMGGTDKPPEEPLLSTAEEGFGYFTDAAVGRALMPYMFVRKLGWAGSSSVWLAQRIPDEDSPVSNQLLHQYSDASTPTQEFVAIKILTAQATARILAGHSPEFEVYNAVDAGDHTHGGFSHCLTVRHCFIAESEAGGHICFVTDALSSSLATLRKPGENRFTLPIAKRIIKQVLLALDYLHRECKYIHTDVKSDNILVSIPAASRIPEYIQENPSSDYGPALDLGSKTLPLVFSRSQPLPYFGLGGSIENISVRLVDYSEATSVERTHRPDEYLRQPSIIRAPEVTLRYPWTSAIDIWTVGCLLFELLTERSLFSQDPDTYSHELHLQYIVECLGPFPQEFLNQCQDRGKYFDDEGTLRRTTSDSTPTSFEDILRTLKVVDEKEIPGTAAFLRRCLTLNPNLRPSAQELLKDSWLLDL